jgi:hypothetical protein
MGKSYAKTAQRIEGTAHKEHSAKKNNTRQLAQGISNGF